MNLYIFKYHEVTNNPHKSGFTNKGAFAYKHKENDFDKDLKILINRFKKTTTITKIKNKQNNLILTFDDGGVSAIEIAKKLLKLNCIAHFFIVTSLINKKNFLSTDQIKEISNMGHIVGSHSHTHPTLFRDLPMKEKIFQWSKSKTILEDILSKKITTASVPGGDMNDETIKAASISGIKHLFTSEPGLKRWQKYGVTCYPAFCPKNNTSQKLIFNWANGKGLIRLKIVRVIKNHLKKFLKPLYKLNLLIFSVRDN